MSNRGEIRQRDAVVVLADGNEYKLRFDMNAFEHIEDEYGDVDTVMEKVTAGSPRATKALVWAGMQCHHPELTRKEVGALIDLRDLTEIAKAVYGGVMNALPQGVDPK